jgi:hypothetical protein
LLVPIAAGKSIPPQWSHYPIIGGIKADEWDGFHDFVLWDELFRGGAISSIFIGLVRNWPNVALPMNVLMKRTLRAFRPLRPLP